MIELRGIEPEDLFASSVHIAGTISTEVPLRKSGHKIVLEAALSTP